MQIFSSSVGCHSRLVVDVVILLVLTTCLISVEAAEWDEEFNWFPRYKEQLGVLLKRCMGINNAGLIPQNGELCPRKPEGQYLCLFGKSVPCADAVLEPTVGCRCGPDGLWTDCHQRTYKCPETANSDVQTNSGLNIDLGVAATATATAATGNDNAADTARQTNTLITTCPATRPAASPYFDDRSCYFYADGLTCNYENSLRCMCTRDKWLCQYVDLTTKSFDAYGCPRAPPRSGYGCPGSSPGAVCRYGREYRCSCTGFGTWLCYKPREMPF